ncbi:MAG: hypothetical protein HKN34_06200 [Gammaproteobacteria bacterium]|nr:hypothetical protein [Gammaproteobacteria bacterium]
MQIFRIAYYGLLSLLIIACGGGSSSSSSGGGTIVVDEKTVINSFTLTGSAAPIDGVTPINASVSGGKFTIAWDIESTTVYNFRLFVSDNNTYEISEDPEIFALSCGPVAATFNCNQTGHFDCRFNSSNEMSCGVVAPGNLAEDLTSFLTALPAKVFLIAQACNSLAEDCEIAPVAIELQ